ncbi:MAG: GNAT family N-acetyltransferase [bacterium]|nr:GNAT family N-acetyltransferase [bacterium]
MKDIRIKKIDSSEAPMKILLLADPSKESIKKYLKKGSCFAAYEKNTVIGAYILISPKKEIMEIANIAVDKSMQNKGVGKILIKDAIKRAKKEGMKKLLVGTGNSSINQLVFYQKCGFRISGIKKDFFIKNYKKPIFENGIQCRDMIMLEIIL